MTLEEAARKLSSINLDDHKIKTKVIILFIFFIFYLYIYKYYF